jgi:nitroreductase
MKLIEVIKTRRSIMKFKPDPIDTKLVIEFLDAAIFAPQHRFHEPWRFLVVANDGRAKISSQITKDMTAEEKTRVGDAIVRFFTKSPVVIGVIMPKPLNQDEYLEDLQACGAMIQNFALLAHETGLGTAWKTPPYIKHVKLIETFGVRADEELIALVQVGAPEEQPQPRLRKSAKEKTILIDK